MRVGKTPTDEMRHKDMASKQSKVDAAPTQDVQHLPVLAVEQVALSDLQPHPRNYQAHPDDELAHIMESITTHGFYRNVVIAQDGTILAGHGVVEASRKLGLATVPAIRVDYAPDDPRALKLLVSDNEIRHLAEVDDRALSELLKELNDLSDLLGTGYDEMMLANLALVTRPADEIEDIDAAAQWAGMPEYDDKGADRIQIIVNFANEQDRAEFCRLLGLDARAIAKEGHGKSIWWPKETRDDLPSVRFTGGDGAVE